MFHVGWAKKPHQIKKGPLKKLVRPKCISTNELCAWI